ncbi:hypothetical protein X943_000873 [Babesia divergens]|uniref:SWIM-type domain-containing protein n=1 Tax=Babesia divergens TaxID=32595 RepID=A0AAD9LIX7_BABDI|nr:hypothetical protein X943_000873 [Babesia divergens]
MQCDSAQLSPTGDPPSRSKGKKAHTKETPSSEGVAGTTAAIKGGAKVNSDAKGTDKISKKMPVGSKEVAAVNVGHKNDTKPKKSWPASFPLPLTMYWTKDKEVADYKAMKEEEEGNYWIDYLKRDVAFRKAVDITNIVAADLSPSHLDSTIQMVYSYTEHRRNVDMLLFKCDCPNTNDMCSHIMAAAMRKQHQREKIIKLVTMVEMKKQIRAYMKKHKLATLGISDIATICRSFNKLDKEEDALQILLQIVAGIIYRSMQATKMYSTHAKMLQEFMDHDVTIVPDYALRNINAMVKRAFAILDRLSMAVLAEEMSVVADDTNATLGLHCDTYEYDLYYGYSFIKVRVEKLVRSLVRTFNPRRLALDKPEFCNFMWTLAKTVLEKDLGIINFSESDNHHLSTIVGECYAPKYSVKYDPLIMDGYAVGFDYRDVPHTEREEWRINNEQYYAMHKTLTKQILNVPYMEDVSKHTFWDAQYCKIFGSITYFLESPDLKLHEKFTFITVDKGTIIKVPSTNAFPDPIDVIPHIMEAVIRGDARSFTAHGITLLAMIKAIELLPPWPWNSIAELLFDENSTNGTDFVAECINLLPDLLLLPFFQAYFRKTYVLTKECMEKIAIYMHESIIKGRMTEFIYAKMLKLGSFYDIPVKKIWRKARGEVDKAARQMKMAKMAAEAANHDADAATQTHTNEDESSSQTKNVDETAEQTKPLDERVEKPAVEGDPSCPENKDQPAKPDATVAEASTEQTKNVPINVNIRAVAQPHQPSEVSKPTQSSRGNLKETIWAATEAHAIKRGKALIDDIRRTEFGVGIIQDGLNKTAQQRAADTEIQQVMEKQSQRLARSIKRLSEDLYNTRIHLQLELLQNADDNEYDCKSPEIIFLLDPEAIVVMNNECGFKEKDVRSLCDIGTSTKLDNSERKIGKFGIGFKSVFLVTQSPHIFSNGYHFMFSSDPGMKNNTPYIMPHWVDITSCGNPFGYVRSRLSLVGRNAFVQLASRLMKTHGGLPKTILYLPLKQDLKSGGWHQYYSEFQGIGHLHLAFLRRLTAITFVDVSKNSTTTLKRETVKTEHFYIEMRRLKQLKLAGRDTSGPKVLFKDANLRCEQVALVTHKNADGMVDDSELHTFIMHYRFDLDDTEAASIVATRNEGKDCLVTVGIPIHTKETKWSTFDIYNVLPVAQYGLPFLVNGDFVISTSRQSIIDHDPWNKILARKAGEAFSIMTTIIAKKFRDINNLYLSAIRAIPEAYSGKGCFESCCEEIHKMLREMQWVAVNHPEKALQVPSKAFLPLEKTILPTKRNHQDVMCAMLPPKLLNDYCDMGYASEEVEEPTIRDTMLDLGVEILTPAFILKVFQQLRRKVDLSVPLAAQPEAIRCFFNNIGALLCVIERVASLHEVDDIRRSMLLVNTQDMLMTIGDAVMFIRDDVGLDLVKVDVIVDPKLFKNPWEIEGYTHRVANVLELMGCIELSESNLLNTLVINQIRLLTQNKKKLNHEEIVEQSRALIHILARNCDKLDSLSKQERHIVAHMPIVLENGEITHLTAENIKFCPHGDLAASILGMDLKMSVYFSMVRRFFSEAGLKVRYISQEYLKGVVSDTSPETSAVKLRDLRALFNDFGIYTFMQYLYIEEEIDGRGNYELPRLSPTWDEAIKRCRNDRKLDLGRLGMLGCKKVLRDWAGTEFSVIAEAISSFYNVHKAETKPTNKQKGIQHRKATCTSSCGHDNLGLESMVQYSKEERAKRIEKGYNLAILMYRLIDQDLMLYPQLLAATLDPQGNPQVLGKSLFYYQLRNIPWLPYKQAVFTETENGTGGITWQPVAPVSVEDYVAYPSILFFKRDAVVTNIHLQPQEAPPTLDVLEYLCMEINKQAEGTKAPTEKTPTFPVAADIFSLPSVERFKRCFARETFMKALKCDVGVLRKLIGSMYADIHSKSQENVHVVSKIRVDFAYKQLIVVFPAQHGTLEVPMTYRSTDPRLAIHQSIVKLDAPCTLEEIYADEFPQLEEFWHSLGVSEFASTEETLRILEKAEACTTTEDMEQVFACVMHLYNTMDNASFLSTVWDRRCIPTTTQHKYMFAFENHSEWDMNTPKVRRVVAPSNGLVALKSAEAAKMVKCLPSQENKGAYMVMRPLQTKQGTGVERYMEKYMRSVGITKHQLWARILSLLQVSDLSDHISLVPVVSPLTEIRQWPLGKYVLCMLLPYVHHYLKHRLGNDYNRYCKRLSQILGRLNICCLFDEVTAEYRYMHGKEEVTSLQISAETLVHCDNGRALRLYIAVEDLPEDLDTECDVVATAQRLVEDKRLTELSCSFFTNLAKIMLVDPDAEPLQINRQFIKSTDEESFLAGFMRTVYEMIRLQSKDTVDLFVRSYNSGYIPDCICTAIEDDPTAPAEAGDTPKAEGDKGDAQEEETQEESAGYILPLVEGYGAHMPTGVKCKSNVMDPLVYMLLMNETKLHFHPLQMERFVAAFSITNKAACPDASEQDEELRASLDTEAVAPSVHGTAGALLFKRLDDQMAKATKRPDDVYERSLLELKMPTPATVKERPAGANTNELEYSDMFTLYRDGKLEFKATKVPLPCMRIRKDNSFEIDSTCAVVEYIDPEKYVSAKNINKKLADRAYLHGHLDHGRNYVVGLLGEKYVYTVLQELLKPEIARKEIKVTWHNEELEKGLAYDISITASGGEKVYIEVKSSVSSKRPDFRISHNQWVFAQQEQQSYEIFRLSGVGQHNTTLVRMMNPFRMWKDGILNVSLSL